MIDFQKLRKEYESEGFDADDLPDDPIAAFVRWYDHATESCPVDWFEPNAMTISTASASGEVSCRWVLLKGLTATGIRFYTNYDSEKANQISENPVAAATFHWPYLGRQVRLQGAIAKTSREDSETYFHSRPRGSQIGAAVSPQSSPIQSQQWLEQRKAELEQQYDGQPIPLPENWGGYELTPSRIEFWQGRSNRLHDRIVFERQGDGWRKTRISP